MRLKSIYFKKAGRYTVDTLRRDSIHSAIDFHIVLGSKHYTEVKKVLVSEVFVDNVRINAQDSFDGSTGVSAPVAFGVVDYAPAVLLINNHYEVKFDTLDFSTVVATNSKHLVLQMVSGRGPPPTIKVKKVSA